MKNFHYQGRFVTFVSRAFDVNHYRIDQHNTEWRTVHRNDDGTMRYGDASAASVGDMEAVDAYRTEEYREYLEWAAARGLAA